MNIFPKKKDEIIDVEARIISMEDGWVTVEGIKPEKDRSALFGVLCGAAAIAGIVVGVLCALSISGESDEDQETTEDEDTIDN